jgi:hypothetical protein
LVRSPEQHAAWLGISLHLPQKAMKAFEKGMGIGERRVIQAKVRRHRPAWPKITG